MLITHKLDEALAAADRVTVLRRGAVILDRAVAGQTVESLADAMIGEGAPDERMRRSGAAGSSDRERPLVGSMPRGPRERRIRNRAPAELSVGRAGEIVGVAAVEGNGQRELLRAVAGRIVAAAWQARGRGAGGVHPRGPHYRRADPGVEPHGERGARARAEWARGSGAGVDWREARARGPRSCSGLRGHRAGAATRRRRRSAAATSKSWSSRASSPRRPRVIVAENPTRGLDIRATARSTPGSARPRGGRGGALLLERPGRGAGARRPVVVVSRGVLIRAAAGGVRRADRRDDAGRTEAARARHGLGRREQVRCSPALAVLALGWSWRATTRRPRSARSGGRLRLLVCLHLGNAGARGAAHHHRAWHLAGISRRRAQHRRRRSVLRRRYRRDLGRTARAGRILAPRDRGGALRRGARRSLWVAVPVWLELRFGVIEVISTLLLNFVAEALVSFMVQGPLQERRRIYPQSDAIAEAARLPLLPGTRLHAGFLLALAGALVLWFLFARTLWGFRLRAVGLGPRAAEVSGRIDSRRMGAMALLCRARSPDWPAGSR